MRSTRISCPAKINLNLKIQSQREDGFHDIESVMQTIDLYDYIDISMIDSNRNVIKLYGDNKDIPYDKTNIVYIIAKEFLDTYSKQNPKQVAIMIDKNIPVSAGLGGGSSDAAGTAYALNKLLDEPINEEELHKFCARFGSDLNVFLKGGCVLAEGRGEKVSPRLYNQLYISLIKPLNLGVSSKYAYEKFDEKFNAGIDLFSKRDYENDLEWAIGQDFEEFKHIKEKYPTAIMTGSGSTFYSLEEDFVEEEGYWVQNGLLSITNGIKFM